jgi:DnaJ homolog subfamily A member 2
LIIKGIHEGEAIIIYGEANQVPGAPNRGDLHLVIEEIPSQTGLVRKGNHLLYTMEIDLADALCGFKKVIKHLDGRNLLIEHQKIVKPGDVYQITGEGMPISQNGRFTDNYGDLIVQFEIKFPERLGKDSKSIEERKNFIRMILPKSKNIKEDEIVNGLNYEEKYLEEFDPHERNSSHQEPHGFPGFERGFVINEDGDGSPGDCVQQ